MYFLIILKYGVASHAARANLFLPCKWVQIGTVRFFLWPVVEDRIGCSASSFLALTASKYHYG